MALVTVPTLVGSRARLQLGGRPVAIATLGCKVNAFESQLISQNLRDCNGKVVDDREPADIYVINTCSVTAEADRQARQQIRRVIRQNPDAVVVVTGCYAQMDPQACAAIPGVDLVLGNDRKLDVHQLLPLLERGDLPRIMVGDLDVQVSLPNQLLSGYEAQSRAFVQAQQGCDQSCTFCIIHRARGPSRSLPRSLVKRQVQRLVLSGYKEVVICGVDLGDYGTDLGTQACCLTDLLRELVAIEGYFRIRLSSIDPAHLESDLIDLLAAEDKLCPHLHLSLQSGNTLILKRMKRRYTRELMYERVSSLRARIPDLVLSADLIVGFPTETEEQFQDTVTMVDELQIAYPHVFRYSERPGTPAARIPKQVSPQVKKCRAARLRRAGDEVRASVMRSRVGRVAQILIEGGGHPPAECQRGRASDYLPVRVPIDASAIGQWAQVKYTGVSGDTLIARPTG